MFLVHLIVLSFVMNELSRDPQLILDFTMFVFFFERGSRYSLFIFSYFIAYSNFLYYPLTDFNTKISYQSINKSINLFRFKKFHAMYVFYLKKFVTLNDHAVKYFFTIAITSHLLANVSIVSGLILRDYHTFVRNSMIIQCFIVLFILYSTNHLCIKLSSRLTKPIPNIFILMHRMDALNGFLKIKCGNVYQMCHTKKPFRFQLGPFGSISNRSFALFCMFYSSQLMHFTANIKRNAQ